jgi:hypothetical protein
MRLCASVWLSARQMARESTFNRGDDEAAMRANIEALDEISEDVTDAKHATICAMVLGEYFQ